MIWSIKYSIKDCNALVSLWDNSLIRFGIELYRQAIGIPVGTHVTLLVADLFRFLLWRKFLSHGKKRDIGNFIGKQLVFRSELMVLVLLQNCFVFFFIMKESLSQGKIMLTMRLSIPLRYCDDLLNINNIYYDQRVDRIYATARVK